MIALVTTIFLASLVGSLHCAGMCGAFALFAIGAGDPRVHTPRTLLMGAYHAGRLLTYVALGAAAGALGSVVDLTGNLVGLQRTAAIAAGAMMVGFGVLTLLRVAGVRIKPLRLPAFLARITAAGHRRSLYVAADVKAGEPLTEANVRSVRPGHGLPPRHLPEVLGCRAARDLKFGEPLDWSMVG